MQRPVASVENGVIKYSDDEDELRKIQFDENSYGVTVNVTEYALDGATTLSAKVKYDSGGEANTPPQFVNATRPGSLEIRKKAEGLTDSNKDAVFTFKVQLSNDAGMPLTGEGGMIYYTEKSEEQSEIEPTPGEPSQPANSEPKEIADAAAAGGKAAPKRAFNAAKAAAGPLRAEPSSVQAHPGSRFRILNPVQR